MILNTKFFGEVKVEDDKLITFKEGIPGFENLTKFLFMLDVDENENSPFYWLQSTEDIDVVFTLFDPFEYFEDYNPIVSIEELKGAIGDFDDENILIYAIANIPDNISDMTINLKAPIVINMQTNLAKQIIATNEDYSIKTNLYSYIKKGGE